MKLIKSKAFWVLVAMLLVHVALVVRQFPVKTFIDGDLPIRGDLTRYFMTASAVKASGSLTGYDPSFMAGAPFGLWNSMGKKGYEFVAWALPFLSIERSMYLSAIIPALLGPLLIGLAVLGLLASPRERLVALCLVLAVWHIDSRVSYFWHFGNTMFPFAAAMVVPFAVAVNRILQGQPRKLWYPVLCLAPAAIFYVHPSLLPAVVIVAVVSAIGVIGRRGVGMRLLACAGAAGVAVAVLTPWLVELLSARADYAPLAYEGYNASFKHLIMDIANDRVYLRHFDRNILVQITVLFASFGLWCKREEKEPQYAVHRALALSGMSVFVFSYAGMLGALTSSLQSYRMQVPGLLLLVPLAAAGLTESMVVLKKADTRVRWVIVILIVCIMPRLGGALLDTAWQKPTLQDTEDRQAVVAAVTALKPEGRVLCEDIYLSHLLPRYAGASVIGDGYGFTQHCFAGFDVDGNLAGRSAEIWATGSMLSDYLDLYALEYAIVSSHGWKDTAGKFGGWVHMRDIGEYSLYRVAGYSKKSLSSGACDVEIGNGRVRCSNIRTNEFILKLHMPSAIDIPDGFTVAPIALLDDPVPFMLVRTQLSEAEIVFGKRKDSLK